MARYLPLIGIAAALALFTALAFPSAITLAVALTVIGGGAAYGLVYWLLRAAAAPAVPPRAVETAPAESADKLVTPPSPTAPGGASAEPPDQVRDRLRLLICAPRPMDAEWSLELARQRTSQLLDLLSQGEVDIELTPVVPASYQRLSEVLQSRPAYHTLLLEAAASASGLSLETEGGQTDEVPFERLARLMQEARVRLLLLRLPQGELQDPDLLLRQGVSTLVLAPKSIPARAWDEFLQAFAKALARGEIIAHAFSEALAHWHPGTAAIQPPLLLGGNWYSLVDRATDGKGARLSCPRSAPLPPQLWFRNQATVLEQLISAVRSGARLLSIAGDPGSGASSLAVELCHRLLPRFQHILVVDCARLPAPQATVALEMLAAQLHLRVPEPDLLPTKVSEALCERPCLVLLDHLDSLPTAEQNELLAPLLAEGGQARVVCVGVSEQGGAPAMSPAPLDARATLQTLRWLGYSGLVPVLADIGAESARSLADGLHGNALAVRLAGGLAMRLGILQAVRTARRCGSLDGLLKLMLERLSPRQAEVLAALALVPAPLSPRILSEALGREAATALQELCALGLVSESAHPELFGLHPVFRQRVSPPPGERHRLLERLAQALSSLAMEAYRSFIQAQAPSGQASALAGAMAPHWGNMEFILNAALSETGPLAGRHELVRDLSLPLMCFYHECGLEYRALAAAATGREAARLLGDQVSEGELLLGSAEIYRGQEDLAAAATAYEEAATCFEAGKDPRRAARCLIRLGTMWYEAGQLPAAEQALRRALTHLERLQDVVARATVLSVLGDIRQSQQQPEQALELYQQALGLLGREPNLQRQLAQLHYRLGQCRAKLGQEVLAAADYERAVSLFTEANDSEGRLQACLALGRTYLALGDRERAIQFLQRAAQLEETLSLGVGATLDLGRAYLQGRRWQEALLQAERALALARSAGDRRGMALAWHSIGNIHLQVGDRVQATQAFQEALRLWNEVGDQAGLARTLNNLAIVYRRAGRWEDARQNLEQAAAILSQSDDRTSLARVYNNLGLVLAAEGKQREAAKYYQRALALKEQLGDLYGMQITRMNLAQLNNPS
jgi:tetratricopeptide (TPR) repeat protein